MTPARAARDDEAMARQVTAFARSSNLADRSRALDSQPEFPWTEFRALGERGWLGPRIPKANGGQGWPLLREARLIEVLSREGGSVFGKLVLQPEFCSVLLHGSPALRQRWFRPLLAGKVLVGNQITEPGAGSDVAALATSAILEGDPRTGSYIVTGTKSEVAFAEDAQAALVYVRAGDVPGAAGVTALLIPQNARGISRELHDDLGERWMRRGTVHYDHVRVPAAQRIGAEGEGFRLLMGELTHERALLGVIYLALAQASLDETLADVMSRRAFGRPLGSFEAISFPLVEDVARLEAARLYLWATLAKLEDGRPAPGESALAKWLANSTALGVLDHAMQFHGGAGYSKRLPHEQRWRDVRSGRVAHGTDEILHIVAAREILGRESVPYGRPPPRPPVT